MTKRELSNTAKLSVLNLSLSRSSPWSLILGNKRKSAMSSTSGRHEILVNSSRRDTSRQSAQLRNWQNPEYRATALNREISATIVKPCDQIVPSKIGEPIPVVYRREEAVQRLKSPSFFKRGKWGYHWKYWSLVINENNWNVSLAVNGTVYAYNAGMICQVNVTSLTQRTNVHLKFKLQTDQY